MNKNLLAFLIGMLLAVSLLIPAYASATMTAGACWDAVTIPRCSNVSLASANAKIGTKVNLEDTSGNVWHGVVGAYNQTYTGTLYTSSIPTCPASTYLNYHSNGDAYFGEIITYSATSGRAYLFRYAATGYTCPPEPPQPTCFDGIQNQDETGIDCGGICETNYNLSCEPATCSDGVKSGNETSVDCGDSECVGDETCTTYCPVGFDLENRPAGGGINLDGCYSEDDNSTFTIDAKLGVCPDKFYKSLSDPLKCVSWAFPTYASHDYLDTVQPPSPADNPWNETTVDETVAVTTTTETVGDVTTDVKTTVKTGTTSGGDSLSETTTETTTTTGDGSKTVVITVDRSGTGSGGTSLSGGTSTTSTSYDPNGNVTGSSTTGTAIESEPGASDPFAAPDGETDFAPDAAGLDLFTARYTEFLAAIETAPIYAPVANLFNGPNLGGATALFSLNMGSYGAQSYSISQYDSTWEALGVLFMFLATLAAARLIFIKGAS